MTDWKDNKDSGPWNFTEQPNKWGYLNNPRWSNQQDSVDFCGGLNLPIGTSGEHAPCGHWHKSKYFPMPIGKWVAAMQQPGTPYIYLYNIGARAVIRVNTALTPPIVDGVLRLNSAYALDYDMGWGSPGTQRGAYCMNKNGTRLWYLFCDQGQYPIARDHPDAELIEVDITSYYMRIVKRTTFPNLLPAELFPDPNAGRINDGCSDNTHTYWCTDLIAGRIIKIRNSDHSIIDDHYFNYPIEACSGDNFDNSISTIDVNKSTGKLFWVYNRDHTHCIPPYNGCGHFIRSDTDLVQEIDSIDCGSGPQTWAWQNMIRVYHDYVLHHRAYHPSFIGWLGKYNSDFTYDVNDFIIQEYLQNILGIQGNRLFTLMQVNNINHPAYLYCINFSNMDEVSNLDVSYYAGQRYPDSYAWDWTSVSALNQQTGKILIFRYHNEEERNYAGCFNADSDLGLLCDVRFERIYDDPTLGPFGEPQLWIMPGDEISEPAGGEDIGDGYAGGGTMCVGQTPRLSQNSISISIIEGSDAANHSIRITDNCSNPLAFQVKEVNNNNYITWISSPVVGNSGVGALNINFNTISLSAGSYTGNIVISTGLGNLTLSITLVVTSSPTHGEASGITLIEGDTYRRFNFRAGEIKLFKFKADSGPSSPTLTVVAETMSHYSHGYLHMMARYAGQNWESPPPNDSDYAAIKAFIVGDPMKFKGIYNDIHYYLSLHLSKRINVNHDPQVTNGCWYTWIKNIGSMKLNDCMIHFRSWG